MIIPPQGLRHAVDLLLKNAVRKHPANTNQLARDLVALGDDLKASPAFTEWVVAEFERIVARPAPDLLKAFGARHGDPVEPRDLFLVYVPEDRLSIAAPLAIELTKRRVSVAFSQYEVSSRDEMLAAIAHGLACHRAGALLVTSAFRQRAWEHERMRGPRLVFVDATSSPVSAAERLKCQLSDMKAINLS